MKVDEQICRVESMLKSNRKEALVWSRMGKEHTANVCLDNVRTCESVVKSLRKLKRSEGGAVKGGHKPVMVPLIVMEQTITSLKKAESEVKRWIYETLKGGWSSYFVDAQKKEAARLHDDVERLERLLMYAIKAGK